MGFNGRVWSPVYVIARVARYGRRGRLSVALAYPSVIVVGSAEDLGLAGVDLSVVVGPSGGNGGGNRCWGVGRLMATVPLSRVLGTALRVTEATVWRIRPLAAEGSRSAAAPAWGGSGVVIFVS